MSRGSPGEAGGYAEGAAFVKTCRLVPTLRTSKELMFLEHLKGMSGDDSGHINTRPRGFGLP